MALELLPNLLDLYNKAKLIQRTWKGKSNFLTKSLKTLSSSVSMTWALLSKLKTIVTATNVEQYI